MFLNEANYPDKMIPLPLLMVILAKGVPGINREDAEVSCALSAGFRVVDFILYNLIGGYTGMNRQELIIMLTVLAVGVCIIVLILLNGLGGL